MLRLDGISKIYEVGGQQIHALKRVSVEFRKSEFVSVLGQSGCGKTTLMNIIGGLDRATEGDLILEGVSTNGFKETDWDDYRNKKIGFVFQNYNLIQHLTVLQNVELALTISGITGAEKNAKARRALDRVGLAEQYNKRPNQLSGGQMQRVAIARAIVNEPDILLADEPTGAIDSETSVQIMEILKEISGEQLVIMVTHNAELAEKYSTRIVRILDGEIISDSMPYSSANEISEDNLAENKAFNEKKPEILTDSVLKDKKSDETKDKDNNENARESLNERNLTDKIHESDGSVSDDFSDKARVSDIDVNAKDFSEYDESAENADTRPDNRENCEETVLNGTPHSAGKRKKKKRKFVSMSFMTSVRLSFRNLLNKRGRSILTAVAGSIGIISIALILAVNNGFSIYINDYEQQSMARYPITVSTGDDSVLSIFEQFLGGNDLHSDSMDMDSILSIFTGENVDKEKYTEEKMVYIYEQFVKAFEAQMNQVNKDKDISKFKAYLEENFDYSLGSVKYDYSINMNIYKSNTAKTDGNDLTPVVYSKVNPLWDKFYPMISGFMGDLESNQLASLKAMVNSFAVWDELVADENTIKSQYDLLAGHMPKNKNEVVLVVDKYNQVSDFEMFALDELGFLDMLGAIGKEHGLEAFDKTFDEILGKKFYVLPTGASYALNSANGLYENVDSNPLKLSKAIESNGIEITVSAILRPKEGLDSGCINGVMGYTGELGEYIINEANDNEFITAQRKEYENYVSLIGKATEIAEYMKDNALNFVELSPANQITLMQAASASIKNVSTGENLTISEYNTLLKDMNVRDLDKPAFIYIYPSSLDSKDKIVRFIRDYNAAQTTEEAHNYAGTSADKAAEKNNGASPADIEVGDIVIPEIEVKPTTYVVEFTDELDAIVAELNTLVNTITYILIAVALVSVLVTMLLIAIIMYISVQDRTREIGILRSLGARKMDISNIFNVETMLLGLASGIIGIILSLILQFPGNMIFQSTLGITELLRIAWWHPLVLIVGAVIITMLSGLIPAYLAAKKDPVIALRTE